MTEEIKEDSKLTKIDQSYYIATTSNRQLMLQRRTRSKKGEETFTTVGYYSSVEALMKSYLQIRMIDGVRECENVREVVVMIRSLKKEVEEIFKGL